MTEPFHEGEIEAQTRAGVRSGAARVGTIIRPAIPPPAQAFLSLQRMVIAATVDRTGRVWASLLTGEPGFIHATDERTIEIAAAPAPGDPLGENARAGAAIGLLAIDLARRKRMRANGQIQARTDDGISVRTRQVYSNCPKYIQMRELCAVDGARRRPPQVQRGSALTETQQAWIERADTFFIASVHPEGGADVSHRGGNPGFVRAVNARRLIFPDYAGNTMFQTLGNLLIDPHAGLLFVDFESGATLQLTGMARVRWDEAAATEFVGAERVVELDVEEVIETADASPLRGHLRQYSPFNPA